MFFHFVTEKTFLVAYATHQRLKFARQPPPDYYGQRLVILLRSLNDDEKQEIEKKF